MTKVEIDNKKSPVGPDAPSAIKIPELQNNPALVSALPQRLRPELRQTWIMEQVALGTAYSQIVATGQDLYGVSRRTMEKDHADAIRRFKGVANTKAEQIFPEILMNLRELYILAIEKGDLALALNIVEKKARFFGIAPEPGAGGGGVTLVKYDIDFSGGSGN